MKLIKEIYDETEITELVDYLEMLREKGVVYKNYEGSADLSDELDESFYYEYVEYILDKDITKNLKHEYDTIRIETDYILDEFNLARVYILNSEE